MAEAQVDVGQAREFLTSVGHAPDAVTKMADADVTKIYTGATKYIGEKVAPKLIPFGEKWREHVAGEDTEAMATLGRFKEPGELWKSYNELRGKVAKGELKQVTPYPDKGTTEQQVAWRKDNGIPEKPEAYDLKLDNGIVIGESDKTMVDAYLKSAHGRNATPSEVKSTLQWYFGELVPSQEKMVADMTKQRETETEAALKQQWGADYQRNMNAAENMIARFVPADSEKNGNVRTRTLNGMKQDPHFAAVMATLALEIDPTTTSGTGTGHDSLQTIDGRLKEIDGFRRKDRQAYNRDEKMQEEERTLLTQKERLLARTKGA